MPKPDGADACEPILHYKQEVAYGAECLFHGQADNAMPRFFFDVAIDGETLTDGMGDDVTSLEAAKLEARKGIIEQARSQLSVGRSFTVTTTVRDETGVQHVERIAVSCELL